MQESFSIIKKKHIGPTSLTQYKNATMKRKSSQIDFMKKNIYLDW